MTIKFNAAAPDYSFTKPALPTQPILIVLAVFGYFFCFMLLPVHAHTSNDWLLVENEIVLEENSDPTPYNLEVRDHVFVKSVSAGDQLTFKILPAKLSLPDDSEISAELSNGEKFSGQEFEVMFERSGTYFLDVFFSDPKSGSELSEEGISITVGALPIVPSISLDGQLLDPNSEVQVSRTKKISFQINSPISSYKYLWDLGTGVAEGSRIEETFADQKMPFYLTVRTLDEKTGTYIDSYIKLTSDDVQRYEVVEPYVVYKPEDSSNVPLQISIGVAVIVILVTSGYIIYQLKKRKR